VGDDFINVPINPTVGFGGNIVYSCNVNELVLKTDEDIEIASNIAELKYNTNTHLVFGLKSPYSD